MDAVILAGGKGSRLDGVMPPYLKPIMPVHGKSLICRITDQVRAVVDGRVIVVVAPENALQISQILGKRDATLIVQRNARGPGDALALALSVSKATDALVLMGDNFMPDDDLQNCVTADTWAVGIDLVATDAARRFTRVYDRPVSGMNPGRNKVYFEEGPELSQPDLFATRVWSGPLVLPVWETLEALSTRRIEDESLGEHKIGPHLNALVSSCGTPSLIKCSNIDIGIPEAAVQVTQ